MGFEVIKFVEGMDLNNSRIGGLPRLESEIQWPHDPDAGIPLLFLARIVSHDIRRALPQMEVTDDLCVSIFICFANETRACARSLAIHEQDQIYKADAGYSRVLVHKMSNHEKIAPSNSPLALPPRNITTEFHGEEDSVEDLPDCGIGDTKFGGTPAWAQDVIELAEHRFVMQINESDIVGISEEHYGIFGGGHGFLFLKSPICENSEGIFFVQFS